MAVSPRRPLTVPVTLSPSRLKVAVLSNDCPLGVFTVQVQVPLGSALAGAPFFSALAGSFFGSSAEAGAASRASNDIASSVFMVISGSWTRLRGVGYLPAEPIAQLRGQSVRHGLVGRVARVVVAAVAERPVLPRKLEIRQARQRQQGRQVGA